MEASAAGLCITREERLIITDELGIILQRRELAPRRSHE
jgi:hypothetical protein